MRVAHAAGGAALAVLLGGGVALAAFGGGTGTAGNRFAAAADLTAPAVPASVVVKTAGGTPGFVRPGGTYLVYAEVTDTGNPAGGVAAVTGDMSALTATRTAVPLASGGFSAGGVAYNRRSETLTADAAVEGARAYSVAAEDAARNATRRTFAVTVDGAPPAAADVQAVNGGPNAGRPEAGDQLSLVYTEPVEPVSVLAGWGGAATPVVVRITNNGLDDQLTVRTAANTAALPLGTVALRGNYVGATTDFGATGTPSSMTVSGNGVRIVLGTPAATARSVTVGAAMSWTAAAGATDRAGNAATGVAAESGSLDMEF
jgi:hypothetical protein